MYATQEETELATSGATDTNAAMYLDPDNDSTSLDSYASGNGGSASTYMYGEADDDGDEAGGAVAVAEEPTTPPYVRQQREADAVRQGLAKLNQRSKLHGYLDAQPTRFVKDRHRMSPGMWNTRFQALCDRKEDDFAKFDQLRALAHDFVFAAETYGRIIISERCVPNTHKTIAPADMGGIAGGTKFMIPLGGIMFKFAIKGGEEIFESDEGAMKVAGHDLNGLMAYFSAIEMMPEDKKILHVPLMALIDYRGYRLVAVCALPIKRSSICYGSCDAGATVHDTYPECNAAMKDVGERMGIAGHLVGASEPKLIYGPGDIECHKGDDKKFYVVDFSRYMPPQPPEKGKPRGAFLYELLRPELVRLSRVPLSPDAFSGMQRDGVPEARKAIRECYALLQDIIVQYADYMDSDLSEVKCTPPGQAAEREDQVVLRVHMMELLEGEIHSRGINVRFLGRIRSLLKADDGPGSRRQLLLAECAARLWKCQLRHVWRDTMENETIPSEEPFRRVAAQFLNLVVSGSKSEYWTRDIKAQLSQKFPDLLSATEREESFDLFALFDDFLPAAVLRLTKFVCIELRAGILTSSKAGLLKAVMDGETDSFEFIASDILHLGCRTKHLNVIDKADAYASMLQARSMLAEGKLNAAERLLGLSVAKLRTALRSCGSDLYVQFKLSECLVELAKVRDKRGLDTAELAMNYQEVHNAITTLRPKLESAPATPLLPRLMQLWARFVLLRLKRGTGGPVSLVEEAFAACAQAVDASTAFQRRTAGINGKPCAELVRAASMFGRVVDVLAEHWSESYPLTPAVLLRAVEAMYPLRAYSKPKDALRLWWMLMKYTSTVEGSPEHAAVMPSWALAEMLVDAGDCLQSALARDPSLAQAFEKRVAATSYAELAPLLPFGGACEMAQATFLTMAASWSECVIRQRALASGATCLLRVLSAAQCGIVKLDLFQSSGVPPDTLLAMLRCSAVHSTLQTLALPVCASYDFVLELNEPFPALESLVARRTSLADAEVAHLLQVSPMLCSLDLSCTRVMRPTTWAHPRITWVDLGFCDIELDELTKAVLAMPALHFLGLAAQQVSLIELARYSDALPQLKKVDLFRCQFGVTAKDLFSDALRALNVDALWLPEGQYMPRRPTTPNGVRVVPGPSLMKLFVDGEHCATFANLSGMAPLWKMTSPKQVLRDLHLEERVIGGARDVPAAVDGVPPLFLLRYSQALGAAKVTYECEGKEFPCHQGTPMPKMHALVMVDFKWGGKVFKLTKSVNMMMNTAKIAGARGNQMTRDDWTLACALVNGESQRSSLLVLIPFANATPAPIALSWPFATSPLMAPVASFLAMYAYKT